MLSNASGINMVYAFKLERVRSHLWFLRDCRSKKIILNGFMVSNKRKNTLRVLTNEGEQLRIKQLKEWMNLVINALYLKKTLLEVINFFLLSREELKNLSYYFSSNQEGKRCFVYSDYILEILISCANIKFIALIESKLNTKY